ncbi:MAG: DUF1501 domain-containing protein [Planctomycetaceae bacterium]
MNQLGHGCNPTHFQALSRRGFLQVGMLAGAGLTLPQLLKSEARAELKQYDHFAGTAKSIIHIYLPGGMAHQESFDPHPYAPIEYRGEMGQVKTKVDGVLFGATLPKTAMIADKISVIRSMSHGEAAHERGTHNMFTGYRPSPALQFPSIGSVISHEFGSRNNLPPYVCVPNMPNEFAGSGYLSSAYAPFSLGSDPAGDGFKVRDLSLPAGVDDSRFATRRSALDAVNAYFQKREASDDIQAMDSFYESAYSLISSPEARDAFDLTKEADKLRDEYGRNQAGSRMLLARRLVESGVRLVNLTYGGWDMHDQIVRGFQNTMPAFDQAYARLIQDLDERGLLDETLVMVSSEFGRTPKINATAGRDHWPKVFSVALAGGGIKRGYVYGTSDATASEPDENPVGVQDLFQTVYHCLGIVADKELMAPGDRPIEIVDGGDVIKDLLA